MVDVNSPDGLVMLIFAALGYCAGAAMFGFGGWVLALVSSLLIRAWSWFYYGFWWDMRYGRFSCGVPTVDEPDLAIAGKPFSWIEEDDGWWRPARWYERIIARWINEKGSQ